MGLLQNLTGWHAVIILAIVLLVFGASKLPALARSVGQSMRIIKTELNDTTTTTSATASTEGAPPSTFPQASARDGAA